MGKQTVYSSVALVDRMVAAVLLGLISCPVRAQQVAATPQSPSSTCRTIVRVDFIAPLAENLLYVITSKRGMVFPLLFSYERLVAPRWSTGAEGIINNGFPWAKTNGVELLARYYARPTNKGGSALTGVFLASQVGYRWISVEDKDPYTGAYTLHGQRLRISLMSGYQCSRKEGRRTFSVLSVSGGLAHWGRLGTDDLPPSLLVAHSDYFLGWGPDVRASVGLLF